MKGFKSMLVLFTSALFFLPSLTSCLGDDSSDNNVVYYLTDTNKSKVMSDITGSYDGKIYYFKESNKRDSVIAKCDMKSDTLASLNIHTALFADYIPSTDVDTKNLLKNSGPVCIVPMRYYIPYAVYTEVWDNYWSQGYYEGSFIPLNDTYRFTIGDHEFSFTLNTDSYIYYSGVYYYPTYTYYQSQLQGYILIKSFKHDGVTESLNAPILFYGKK